jgi:3-hydroxyanthranilate 3,4-dioxygenase
MTDRRPFNLMGWIEEHRDDLKPPVANKQVWIDADMIVMIVGGGNIRNDFHDDPREEFFFQLKGDMNLRIVDAPGEPARDMVIAEGEVYLLAPGLRHSPQRPDPDSIGLVVEYARSKGEIDGFEWYCSNCHDLVHRVEVQLASIVDDLPPLFEAFSTNLEARTCPTCSTIHPVAGSSED